jgi:hypothetical protein
MFVQVNVGSGQCLLQANGSDPFLIWFCSGNNLDSGTPKLNS